LIETVLNAADPRLHFAVKECATVVIALSTLQMSSAAKAQRFSQVKLVTTFAYNAAAALALQRTETHCNALQRTATHCNALQITATHFNSLQLTATHCNSMRNWQGQSTRNRFTACRSSPHILLQQYEHF